MAAQVGTMSLPPWGQRKTRPAKADPVTDEVRGMVRSRSAGRCELCGGPGQHLHHRQLRRGGDHSAANLVHLCNVCHVRVHGHSAWSFEQGWLVSQYSSAATVPLCMGERWVLLQVDGTTRGIHGPSSAVR